MNCILLKPITQIFTYVPPNSKMFELRKTCSTKLLMSILGCGYIVEKESKAKQSKAQHSTAQHNQYRAYSLVASVGTYKSLAARCCGT